MLFQTLTVSKLKKCIKVSIWFFLFVVLYGVIIFVLDYVYTNYGDADIESRIFWHGFYQHENVDNVVVGNSHVYCDINPDILDLLTGEDNANLATPAQYMHQTYYSILEADRIYDIDRVFIEMYYYYVTGEDADFSNGESVKTTWRTTDYMSKLSPIRYVALAEFNDSEHYLEAFYPFLRFRKYMFSGAYINQNREQKNREDFKNYIYHTEDEGIYFDYFQNGHLSTNFQMDTNLAFEAKRIPEEMVIGEEPRKYLEKCVKYCKKKNIEVVLFVSPMWDAQLISNENYDSYITSVRELADKNEVEFYDFNLCKKSFMDLSALNFRDMGHLNESGAAIFTEKFNDVVIQKNVNIKDCFYDSYEEKMKSVEPIIFGAYTRNSYIDERKRANLKNDVSVENVSENKGAVEQDNIRTINLAVSNKDAMEFEIYLTPVIDGEKGEKRKVSDFSGNTSVVVNEDEKGVCTVVSRMKDNLFIEERYEFNY